MTGLQQFIMELQKVADTGNPVWNSTYEFARGIGIKQERERIVELVNEYKNKPDFTFDNLLSLIKGEQK